MISIIAAIDKNRGIGKNNKLVWNIPEDLKHFKKVTRGHPVIMGRKTFESIGKPLSNRTNIVVTRNRQYSKNGVSIVYSLDEAIALAQDNNADEVFIIGGSQLYKQAIDKADRLYLTIINKEFDVDSYFPEYKNSFYVEHKSQNNNGTYKFSYNTLIRK